MTDTAEHHKRILEDKDYREIWFGNLAKTVAVDFDGVLHPYTDGWIGPEPANEEPMIGAKEFLEALVLKRFKIIVFSTRCADIEGYRGTVGWLVAHGLYDLISDVTSKKPPAVAYVDDRAVPYHGNFQDCYFEVLRLSDGRFHGAAPIINPGGTFEC